MSPDDSAFLTEDDILAMLPLGQDYPEIRAAVRAICAKYPGGQDPLSVLRGDRTG